jgi:hypothetical protein
MKKAGTALFALVMFVGMTGLFAYIFLFSVKRTDAYACALEQAARSSEVTRVTGQPLEGGILTYLSSRETQGATARTIFSTSVSGPLGSGRIRADINQAPANSFMLLQFEPDGGDYVDIYVGEFPCR